MTAHWANRTLLLSWTTYDWKSLANRGQRSGFSSAATRSSTGSTYFATTVQLAAVSKIRAIIIVFLWNSKDVHVLFLDISPLHRSIVLVMRALAETFLHHRSVTLWMATWLQPTRRTACHPQGTPCSTRDIKSDLRCNIVFARAAQ
jgi:hypothetical protein